MRLPLSVGKDRLIFTFQARALSNYRGLVPCLRSGERKLQAASSPSGVRGWKPRLRGLLG